MWFHMLQKIIIFICCLKKKNISICVLAEKMKNNWNKLVYDSPPKKLKKFVKDLFHTNEGIFKSSILCVNINWWY